MFWGFFFQKNEKKKLGYEEIVDITTQDYFFFGGGGGGGGGSVLYILRLFLRPRYKMGIFFGEAKISNILWGMPKFLIFFSKQ